VLLKIVYLLVRQVLGLAIPVNVAAMLILSDA
jgi:hypothetical protein